MVYAAQTLFCLTCGGVILADAERLDEDASVKEKYYYNVHKPRSKIYFTSAEEG